jgi:thymidylate synthase ThyX
MWQCNVIADSVNPAGVRLTTFELEYPYIIHGEFMTHRMFSRNAQSNRAIPVDRMIQAVKEDPFTPEFFPANQRGMVGGEELPPDMKRMALAAWDFASDQAVEYARILAATGLHKQMVNRLLMPFQWIRVICTATSYANFFKLRLAKDAEPHMQKLARLMYEAYTGQNPDRLEWGEWHLPYVGPVHGNNGGLDEDWKKLSVARCARVSYLNHDKILDNAKDVALHDQLAQSGHWSPFEHVAQAADRGGLDVSSRHASNFHPSWIQYRKTFKGESGE